ncbi:hypothetical protein V8F06_006411 [Rhypophila decipiens]
MDMDQHQRVFLLVLLSFLFSPLLSPSRACQDRNENEQKVPDVDEEHGSPRPRLPLFALRGFFPIKSRQAGKDKVEGIPVEGINAGRKEENSGEEAKMEGRAALDRNGKSFAIRSSHAGVHHVMEVVGLRK